MVEVLSNRYVFNQVLNADVIWTSRNVRGIEFQTLGAEHENLRAPVFVLHGSFWSSSGRMITVIWSVDMERVWMPGKSVDRHLVYDDTKLPL